MWDPYLKSIRQYAPQAKFMAGKFHVLQMYSRMVDKVRNIEYRKASKKDKKVIKGSRYLLLKNSDNLKLDEKEHLDRWISMARRSRIKVLKQFAKTLVRYREGLLAHCKYQINSGTLEGFNNKIKVLKRVAYGFHNDKYFVLKSSRHAQEYSMLNRHLQQHLEKIRNF